MRLLNVEQAVDGDDAPICLGGRGAAPPVLWWPNRLPTDVERQSEGKAMCTSAQGRRALWARRLSYTLSLWCKLVRFLDYPQIELSNNLAENSMRPVVLAGRTGSMLAARKRAPRVAAILTVVESCRRLGIRLREYLASVLPGLANMSIQRIQSCTSAAWAAFPLLSSASFGPQNRVAQLLLEALARIPVPAAVNQFMPKLISNVLREVAALRLCRQELPIYGNRAFEVPIDFAVVKLQIAAERLRGTRLPRTDLTRQTPIPLH
jgi:hypothetical protein